MKNGHPCRKWPAKVVGGYENTSRQDILGQSSMRANEADGDISIEETDEEVKMEEGAEQVEAEADSDADDKQAEPEERVQLEGEAKVKEVDVLRGISIPYGLTRATKLKEISMERSAAENGVFTIR